MQKLRKEFSTLCRRSCGEGTSDPQQQVVPEYPLHVYEKRPADKVEQLDVPDVVEQLLELVEPGDSFSPLTGTRRYPLLHGTDCRTKLR